MLMRISHQSVTRCKWSRPSLQIWGFVLCSRGLQTLGLNSAGYLSGPTDFGIELCKVPVWAYRLWCFTVRVRINPWGSESSPGGSNQAPGIQIKPWRSTSSSRGPDQALEVQIEPLEVQIKPWVTKRVFKAAGRQKTPFWTGPWSR